jgi:hypothetical protein
LFGKANGVRGEEDVELGLEATWGWWGGRRIQREAGLKLSFGALIWEPADAVVYRPFGSINEVLE